MNNKLIHYILIGINIYYHIAFSLNPAIKFNIQILDTCGCSKYDKFSQKRKVSISNQLNNISSNTKFKYGS